MVSVQIDKGAQGMQASNKPRPLNITTRDQFFDAFGHGSTNQHPGRPGGSLSSTDQTATVYGHDDVSMFDFPTRPIQTSSTTNTLSSNPTPTIAGWESDMRLGFPLSPPGSTVTSPKQIPMSALGAFPPFTSYGQVTPPNDETESILDSDLREHQSKSLKSTNSTSSSPQDEQKPPIKRTRKYTARNSKRSTFDLNDPGDVRRSKFLERNRVAASKCRQKKKEWTSNLESRARDLQTENNSLRMCIDSLKEEFFYLKNQITEHKHCECREIQEYLENPAHQFSAQDNLPARNVFASAHHKQGQIEDMQHPSSDGESESSMKMEDVASDENALGALLTSSIQQDTSDQGISKGVQS